MPLLILGDDSDPHVSRVVEKLEHHGVRSLIYSLADSSNLSAKFDSALSWTISARAFGGSKFEESPMDNLVVWLRNKRRHPVIENEEDRWLDYQMSERRDFFLSFLISNGISHFNPIQSISSEDRKLLHLEIAQKSGLTIPRTLVASDRSKALQFVDACENDCIIKPLKQNFMRPTINGSIQGSSVLINTLSKAELEQTCDLSFAAAPVIIQQRCKKRYEYRVVSFGKNSCWYQVDSQSSELGTLDWRRAQFERIFSRCEQRPDYDALLFRFLESARLKYGIFDIVEDPDGQLIFLECNVDGQWAWLEGDSESGEISEMFADQIASLPELNRH